MPIVRTYGCPECNHIMEVTLTAEQWDDPPPDCPRCAAWDFEHPTQQIFKPPAIGGSNRSKAVAVAEKIAAEDYNVANMNTEGKEGHTPKVRYKDAAVVTPSTWGIAQEALQSAITAGRESRLKYGSGLDVLQHTLKTGDQPDLIELSKKRSARIW